jgi:hypothetical protein
LTEQRVTGGTNLRLFKNVCGSAIDSAWPIAYIPIEMGIAKHISAPLLSAPKWWLVVLAAYGLSLYALPHNEISISLFITYSFQSLLALMSFSIARNERVKRNIPIFLNFGLFFSLSFAGHIGNFVGTVLFPAERFARVYYNQYVCFAAYFFLLALAVVYLTVDTVLRAKSAWVKYALTLAIVGVTSIYYYHPILSDPQACYKTSDILDLKSLDTARQEFEQTRGFNPGAEGLSSFVRLKDRSNAFGSSLLDQGENTRRVQEIYPYLAGNNYLILVWKPIYLNSIYISVLCIFFIFVYFGYQYLLDPPQGAYIDKIMFLFLIFSSMEILHAMSMVKAIEWEAASAFLTIGNHLSLAILMLIAVLFFLRLVFITSVKGEFYEQELASRPGAITRWRDTLDNLVIEKFFDRKALLGRMFVDPRTGNAAKEQKFTN